MHPEQLTATLGEFLIPWGLKVIGAVSILLVGRIAAGLANRLARRSLVRANLDQTLAIFFSRLAYIAIMAFAVVASLARFGVQTT